MEFLKKYGWIILLIILVGAYIVFKDKIDRLVGSVKDVVAPGAYSCKSTFYAKSSDGKTFNVWTSDEGTASSPKIRYYKQMVELDENGSKNIGDVIFISKEEFDGSCKDMFTPTYAWYNSTAPENMGHTTKDKMRAGGISGGAGHGAGFGSMAIVGSYGTNVPQYYPLFDNNGNEVNTPYNAKKKACPIECLKPYPKGSQFEKYYYCSCLTTETTFE